MRSRYTAFALGDADYLARTWHPATRPATIRIDPAQRWLGLRIYGCEAGNAEDAEGWVEFAARYKKQGRGGRLRERSRFLREGGRWRYVDGVIKK